MQELFNGMQVVVALALTASPAIAADYVCKNIEGMAYYPEDRQPQWNRDGVSNGSFAIRINGNEEDDVLFTRNGITKSLAAEGGSIIKTGTLAKHGFDGLMIWYTKDGLIEQYSVFGEGSKFSLAWSTFRAPIVSGQPAKIGSYTANCEKR